MTSLNQKILDKMAITTAQLAQTVRLVANNISGIVKQKNKIKERMDALEEKYAKILAEKKAVLQEQYDGLVQQQELLEAPIKDRLGYSIEELTVTRTIDAGIDSRGNASHRTVIELRYPETVVPPSGEGVAEETVFADTGTRDGGEITDMVDDVSDLPFA